MAWQACSNDIILSYPTVSCGEFADITSKVGYRLFADTDGANVNNPIVRIDITYLHVTASIKSTTVGDGYWNAAAVSWFLGNNPNMLNQEQLDKNNERTDEGYYINTFAWPYNRTWSSSSNDYPLPVGWSTSVEDVNYVMWNSLPVFSFSCRDDVQDFTEASVSYGKSGTELTSSSLAIMWGQGFTDTGKYSGNNANGQQKVLVTKDRIDVATSALQDAVTGRMLTYDNESSVSPSNWRVANPYYDDNAIASITLTASQLDEYGLLKYDPDGFKNDGLYDPYIIKAYTIPLTWWQREYNYEATGAYGSKLTRMSSSENEITLMYEEFDMPDYPLPDPVKPIGDDTVFRLKKKINADGTVETDQNGNPILEWVKCERIGQE